MLVGRSFSQSNRIMDLAIFTIYNCCVKSDWMAINSNQVFNVSKFIIGRVCVWKAWGEIGRRTVNVCKYGVVHFYWQQLSLISWTPRVNKALHSSLSLQKVRSEMAPSWQTRWKIVGLFLYGSCLNCRFLFRQKSEVKFRASLAAQGKRKIKKVKLR